MYYLSAFPFSKTKPTLLKSAELTEDGSLSLAMRFSPIKRVRLSKIVFITSSYQSTIVQKSIKPFCRNSLKIILFSTSCSLSHPITIRYKKPLFSLLWRIRAFCMPLCILTRVPLEFLSLAECLIEGRIVSQL